LKTGQLLFVRYSVIGDTFILIYRVIAISDLQYRNEQTNQIHLWKITSGKSNKKSQAHVL